VSEGTLTATGLLAALVGTGDDGPALLMIDDLEHGLHPKAQRDLVGVLRTLLEAKPELQILVTTHSPYVIDELGAEEVYVLNTDAEGVAHARRLSEHPKAEYALEVLTTGELWGAEGEAWVLEQMSDEPAPKA
jgi:predicted ATPase